MPAELEEKVRHEIAVTPLPAEQSTGNIRETVMKTACVLVLAVSIHLWMLGPGMGPEMFGPSRIVDGRDSGSSSFCGHGLPIRFFCLDCIMGKAVYYRDFPDGGGCGGRAHFDCNPDNWGTEFLPLFAAISDIWRETGW